MVTEVAAVMAIVAALGVGVTARAASVVGAWTVTIDAAPPHPSIGATLTLTQDGKKVSGTFASEHTGTVKVDGQFADGQLTLTLAVPGADASQATTLTAKFKNDNTLVGYVSGPMGDMTWTATRAKDGR